MQLPSSSAKKTSGITRSVESESIPTTADFDPKAKAYSVMWAHIMMKGLQTGGVLGLLAAPVATMLRTSSSTDNKGKSTNTRNSLALAAEVCGWGLVAGTTVAVGLGAVKVARMTPEDLHERVYRLHYSDSQQRCDRLTEYGAVLGLGALGLLLQQQGLPLTPLALLGGVGAGAAAGLAAHIATRPAEMVGKNKVLHELRH